MSDSLQHNTTSSNFLEPVTSSNISSGPTPKHPGWITLPVFGLPGYKFHFIHLTALSALSISIICSAGVLIYLNFPCKRNFFTRSIGERLVVYLAFCDLMFSCSHVLDHAYMTATLNFPPDVVCQVFAFWLSEFIFAQSIIVSFTAINALVMVGFGKRMNLGRYDWRLNLTAFGIPGVLGAIACFEEAFGPSGAWCYVDFRNPAGPKIANVISMFLLAAFLIDVLGYVGVFLKMRAVEMKLKKGKDAAAKGSGSTKYHSTARIMMLFVLVYITQYWALTLYGIWAVAGNPPILMIWFTVLFSNIGGLLNFLAYTVVRKKQSAAVKPSEGKTNATGVA